MMTEVKSECKTVTTNAVREKTITFLFVSYSLLVFVFTLEAHSLFATGEISPHEDCFLIYLSNVFQKRSDFMVRVFASIQDGIV